jgi:hypothetical protein
MRNKIIVLIVLLFLGLSTNASAQYRTGIGARLGFFNGFTIKHFLNDQNALEGIVSTRWNGFVITGLYEWQKPFPDVPNLDWFIGGGAHIGFWGEGYYNWEENQSHTIIGADFIIGLEYTFKDVPISLSLDWKPAFNFIGYSNWWGDGAALSVRYTFK